MMGLYLITVDVTDAFLLQLQEVGQLELISDFAIKLTFYNHV